MRGIESFRIRATPAELDDLRARLRPTRWPDAPEDAGWSMGTDVGYLRELVTYWAEQVDWPAQEAALARLPRFRTRVRDLGICFLHAWAARPALLLVLCHGWPDSSWRYEKVLPLLTDPGARGADPADAFDVVVPDMPGFGHSDRSAGAPLDSVAVAGLWARLMSVLGYAQFGVAGGDIGSAVSRYVALNHRPSPLPSRRRSTRSSPERNRAPTPTGQVAWPFRLPGANGHWMTTSARPPATSASGGSCLVRRLSADPGVGMTGVVRRQVFWRCRRPSARSPTPPPRWPLPSRSE